MALKPVHPSAHRMSSGPGHPKPSLQLDTTTSTPIPAFLQNILTAHPAPQTPSPANPNPSSTSAALYTLPQAPPPPEDPLIPPENFSLVCSGVYRSGFPKKRNFEFMETLRLKTVLTLVLEDYPDSNLKWCEERDVQFMVSPDDQIYCLERAIELIWINSNSVYQVTRQVESRHVIFSYVHSKADDSL